MSELIFTKVHAMKAIRLAEINGRDWLYKNYPKPNGQKRKSSTGFLMHKGIAYPVKPLGRLASEIAGRPVINDPNTNGFRDHFSKKLNN